ncbi:hypothetical protein Srot_0495 [Segniliparus rotundus DSM 44985]|uniref:DUF998 domain-containing protein n=2 Tax=Segniliparus rotundus TaxID=286802 RepID=D6ZC04_SEGRD|nr:hypothetical protein Srot_0495 [Segniliparus rotundus DSM 44985]
MATAFAVAAHSIAVWGLGGVDPTSYAYASYENSALAKGANQVKADLLWTSGALFVLGLFLLWAGQTKRKAAPFVLEIMTGLAAAVAVVAICVCA